MAVTAAGLLLCGCANSASTGGAAQSTGASAHPAHRPASATDAGPGTTSGKPDLILDGQIDARPGEMVQMMLNGVSHARGGDAVTARSPAFSGPVRLRWDAGNYWAQAALGMTDKPGWYPLTVAVHGRTVARDRIHVIRSRRPAFDISASGDVTRPGERVSLEFDDLYPGERGTDFTVRSAALPGPVRLVHEDSMVFNPRDFEAWPELRPVLADGTYTFELYGPHGRRVAEKRLKVRASRPGDADYLGKTYGPEFFDPGKGYSGGTHNFRGIGAGRQVAVMLHDENPDPGEETRLTATSPAFTGVLHLRHDDTKGADGDDPRFLGTATVRSGLTPGRYPVTIVSHHGRVTNTEYLTVTAR